MNWKHPTTTFSARLREISEISDGKKLCISIVESILRLNSPGEFLEAYISVYATSGKYIKYQLHFSKSSPEEKF